MSRIRNALLPHERGLQPPQVVDAATPLMAGCPPLWDAPVAFVLSSLEKAGVRVAERCFEAGETIYIRGDRSELRFRSVLDGGPREVRFERVTPN
jgi:hypothetical protein